MQGENQMPKGAALPSRQRWKLSVPSHVFVAEASVWNYT